MIKVLDAEGKITFRAMTAKEYTKLKVDLKKAYTEKGKAWLAARKRAEADDAEFTEARPVKPRYKALDKVGSRASALKLAGKYQKQYEAKRRAKKEAETL